VSGVPYEAANARLVDRKVCSWFSMCSVARELFVPH
jgi:hypothetical protein